MAIEGVAYSGKFSSDRTIQEYCTEIWKVSPVAIPKPTTNPNARVRSFANLVEAAEQNPIDDGVVESQYVPEEQDN